MQQRYDPAHSIAKRRGIHFMEVVPTYRQPCLLIIFGPPAVGKTSVALRIGDRTNFKVLYNHLTIDFVSRFFDYGTPSFDRLNEAYRLLLLQEAANSNRDLILTVGWRLDVPADGHFIAEYIRLF